MKKTLCLFIILAILLAFSACSEKTEQENDISEEVVSENEEVFDPKEYNYTEKDAQNLIQWNLDIIYKSAIPDEGAATFGLTEEDVENFHINEILRESENLVTLVGAEKYYEDIHERCFIIIENTYKKANYTVGEAFKTSEKSFNVELEIVPFLWMDYVKTHLSDFFEKLYQEYPEMAFEDVPEEEYEKYEKILSDEILKLFEEASEKAEYGEPETIIVEVVQLEDGTWDTTEESFNYMISEILK